MESQSFGPDAFQRATGVSRETLEKLVTYQKLLENWSEVTNLVGRQTLPQVWERHFYDSAQLWPILQAGAAGPLVDLGSGAGFPGLVLAILGWPAVTLVESDQRKAAFLSDVSRETATPVTVLAERSEQLSPISAQWVTARALAPLDRLLDYAVRHVGPGGSCLFLKGRQALDELAQAERRWRFRCDRWPSLTSSEAWVLKLSDIERRR